MVNIETLETRVKELEAVIELLKEHIEAVVKKTVEEALTSKG